MAKTKTTDYTAMGTGTRIDHLVSLILRSGQKKKGIDVIYPGLERHVGHIAGSEQLQKVRKLLVSYASQDPRDDAIWYVSEEGVLAYMQVNTGYLSILIEDRPLSPFSVDYNGRDLFKIKQLAHALDFKEVADKMMAKFQKYGFNEDLIVDIIKRSEQEAHHKAEQEVDEGRILVHGGYDRQRKAYFGRVELYDQVGKLELSLPIMYADGKFQLYLTEANPTQN